MGSRVAMMLGASAFFVCRALVAQTPVAKSGDQRSVIRTATREVLVDLIVRDKHHHAVADLRPDEVAVYEDGVRQKVRVFRSVQGTEQLPPEKSLTPKEPATDTPSAVAPPVQKLEELNFVAVVFAQISPLDLDFARQAVLEFLKSETLPNTYVTIYRLDRTLNTVQMYTNDKTALAKAVDAAAKGLYSKDGLGTNSAIASSAEAVLKANAANIMSSPNAGPETLAAIRGQLMNPMPAVAKDPLWAANASAQDVSITLGNALRAQATLETGIRFVDSRVGGMNAMDSLHELVRSQQKLPGRKVILYLSDGLRFPVNQRDVVDNLISYANRSGVAFYTIDTRGLNPEDPMMQSRSALERAAAESVAQGVDPRSGHREDDDIQLAAVSNNQLALRELAESTGGFAVANTNEIAAPMRRIMEDIRTHYELAYTPTNPNYDGRFRKIEVRVTRPKVTVQSRKGYYALPELNGEPLQPFEAAALNAINTHPSAAEFPYQIALMQFRPKQNSVDCEMAFEIPISQLKVVSNPKTGTSAVRLSMLALIRDPQGEIVNKVGRSLSREVSSKDLAQLENDRVLYAEPLELANGHYVVDTAVTDELAGKTSVKRISVFADARSDFGLSSVEVVRRMEPVAGTPNPLDPFQLESGRIFPTLMDSEGSGKPVRLYFILYLAKTGEVPKVTLQLLRDGKEVARRALALPKARADRSIPLVMEISPGPGQYDIFVTAEQGPLIAQSTRSLKIE